MAATIADIVKISRDQLSDSGDNPYWTDQELARHTVAGIRDLWRAMEGLNEHYQQKINDTSLTLPANTSKVSMPSAFDDLYKIKLIEPRDSGILLPLHKVRYDSLDAYASRGYSSVDISISEGGESSIPQGRLYYSIDRTDRIGRAPVLRFSPTVSSDLDLTVTYIPTLESLIFETLTSESGRGTIFNGSIDPASPLPNQFFEVDISVPSSSDGQLVFGYPNEEGSSVSPIFEWRLVRTLDTAAVGDMASSTNGVAFLIAHEGSGLRSDLHGEVDYSDRLIDIGSVILGQTEEGKLLIALNSQLSLDTLLPISPLKVYHVQQAEANVRIGDVKTAATIPLVGEPDHALMSYAVAFALAKQRDQRTPDLTWLQVYQTEKVSIINSLADPGEDTTLAGDAGVYQVTNDTDINIITSNFSSDA